tara:strand:+ start:9718 stop:10206 length:489 start_codon:yes stop_codon:yes gene_type:complete
MTEINKTMLEVRTLIDKLGLDFNEGDAVTSIIMYSLIRRKQPLNNHLPFTINEQLNRAVKAIRRDAPTPANETLKKEPYKPFKKSDFLKESGDYNDPYGIKAKLGRPKGSKNKPKTKKPTGGKGKKRPARQGKKNRCSRCGRLGHKRPSCTYKTHINGKTLK